jgi:hypothetical protein
MDIPSDTRIAGHLARSACGGEVSGGQGGGEGGQGGGEEGQGGGEEGQGGGEEGQEEDLDVPLSSRCVNNRCLQ